MLKDKSPPAENQAEPSFNRAGYLKEVRNELLIKLGLPPDAKPEKVLLVMQIKAELAKINPEKPKP